MAYTWMMSAGIAKNNFGSWEQAVGWCRRAIETNQNYPSASLGRCPRVAWPPQRGAFRRPDGLALNPAFSISRARAAWTPRGDNLTYLAQLEPLLEGMRKPGVPGE